jgi:hypothetical protein
MFFIGSGVGVGSAILPKGRVGGRRTTPCMTGSVRVLRSLTEGAVSFGPVEGCAGWLAASAAKAWAVVEVFVGSDGGSTILGASGGGRGGGAWPSGRFLALKKMSGHGMVQKRSRNVKGLKRK